MEMLPNELKEIANENRYAYIFSKATLFLSLGAEQFRINDCFNYPLKDWNEDKLISGCNQIVYNLKGLSPESCFENMTKNEFKNLFELFHFEMQKTEPIANNVIFSKISNV